MSAVLDSEPTYEQMAAEALALAGGGRAILLQIAHPAVGRGVVEHSDFALRAMDRFHGTMTFVYASVFGTTEEYREVLRRVNRAHVPVQSSAEGPKPAYNAFDPHLQLWVAATLFRTMMELHQKVFGPLSPEGLERVYRGMVEHGRMLQIAPDRWPATVDAFDAYWESTLCDLRVTDDTRRVAGQLLDPGGIPRWLRVGLPEARLLTAGLLPPSVREQFGLPWNERHARRFDRRMRFLSSAYPRTPLRLRHGPRDAYLRRLRASMVDEVATGEPG